MIRPSNSSLKVYLYTGKVDMRRQIDGLAGIVEHQMALSPFDKSLFVFANRRRDKIKILYWEKSGFVLWYKRLEKARFHWPDTDSASRVSIKELNWLLDGYDIFNFKPHEVMRFSATP